MNRKLALFSLFAILFLFCLPNVFSAWCYQETANIPTACGGLSVGFYNITSSYFYITYLKPAGTTNSSKWQVKYGNNSPSINLTIPTDCYNYLTYYLNLRLFSSPPSYPPDYYYELSAQCYNGSIWKNITYYSNYYDYGATSGFDNTNYTLFDGDWTTFAVGDSWKSIEEGGYDSIRIYEEAMWWKDINATNFNITSIIDYPDPLNVTQLIYINATIVNGSYPINQIKLNITNSTGILIYSNNMNYVSGNLWSINVTTNRSFVGLNNYSIIANDTFGFNSTSKSSNFTVINLPPNVTLTYPANNQIFNSSTTLVKLNWTSSNYDGYPVTDSVYINNGSGYYQYYSQTHNPGNYSTDFYTTPNIIYFWYVNSSDNLNITKSETRNFTVSLILPVINGTTAIPNPVVIGEEITINATIISGSNPISAVWAVIWQGVTTIWQSFLYFITGALWSVSISIDESFDGSNNYTIYANDTAGNNATSINGSFYASNNPPSILLIAPNNLQIFKSATHVALDWNCTDDGGSVNDTVYVNNGTGFVVKYSANHAPGWYEYNSSVTNGTNYSWYVTCNDGTSTATSETRTFYNSYACIGSSLNFVCGDSITQSCSLNGNLSTSGNCFIINTNSITLNGNKYTIKGDGIGFDSGILSTDDLPKSAMIITNLTISNFYYGINLNELNQFFIQNNIITSCIDTGIILGINTLNGSISNNTLSYNAGNGILISSNSHTNLINENRIQTNGRGIYLIDYSYNNTFTNNWINYSYFDGTNIKNTSYSNYFNNTWSCNNNRADNRSLYFDFNDMDSTNTSNTTCDTAYPEKICDFACIGGVLNPSIILNYPNNSQIFNPITTAVTLNWTSSYYSGNVTDKVYVNNGSGYYELYSKTHIPGTYNTSLAVSNNMNYSWYVNVSVGSKINQSEIRTFSVSSTVNPVVNSVTAYPIPQASYWNVTINASITNGTYPVDKAIVRVENPIGVTIYTGDMTLISGRWINRITTNDTFLGTNYYFVSANNTIGGNSNTLNGTFVINNPSPSIILNSPANGQIFPLGTTTVTLNFTSIDNNPTVVDTVFLLNASDDVIVFNTTTHSPGTYTFVVNVTNGSTYKWYVISDDTYSLQTTSVTRTFSVGSATIGCVGATQTFVCGQTVTESCIMNGDLTTTGECFRTGASNIIINGNGKSISGSKSMSYFGIRDLNSYGNLTIKNFRLNDLGYGIYLQGGVQNSTIYNNTINNTLMGIGLVTTLRNVIDNNKIYNSDKGIVLEANSNQYNNITNNIMINDLIGLSFYQSYYNYLNNNTILGSNDTGLFMSLSYYNNFYNTIIYNSSIYGLYLLSNAQGNNFYNTLSCNTTQISTNNWCYQESANVSTACGGLNTGKYNVTENIFFINYTKPANALNTSKWQVKHGVINGIYNITIPELCWNQPTLLFRIYSLSLLISQSVPYCYNGTNWQEIGANDYDGNPITYFGVNKEYKMYDGNWDTFAYGAGSAGWSDYIDTANHAKVYEEAMWWNIQTSTSGYDYYDADTNTETNTTCDRSNPSSICDIYCNGTIIHPTNLTNLSIVLNSPANGASFSDATTSVTLNFTSSDNLTSTIDSLYVDAGLGFTLVYQQTHTPGIYTYSYPISASGTYRWYATSNDSISFVTTATRNFTVSGTAYPLVTLIHPLNGMTYNYFVRQVEIAWNCADPYFSTLTNRLYVNSNLIYSASLPPGNKTFILNTSSGHTYNWYVQCQSPIRTTTSSIWTFSVLTKSGVECTTNLLGLCIPLKEIGIGLNNMFDRWYYWLPVLILMLGVVILVIFLGQFVARRIRGE